MTARRPPPPFRRVEVSRTEAITPRLQRVVFSGPELSGLVIDQPAASVRVLMPSPDTGELEIPEWTGNQFVLGGGRRPLIRTLTPRRFHPARLELEVNVVIHDRGAGAAWARQTQPGDQVAVSGPARGYTFDPDAEAFLLAGDETALPAISQLLEHLPPGRPVSVKVEIARPDARLDWPARSGFTVDWLERPPGGPPGDQLVAAMVEAEVEPGTRVWVAGEAAAVQRVRRDLFERRGLPRTDATVRGYWKYGRAGDAESDGDVSSAT